MARSDKATARPWAWSDGDEPCHRELHVKGALGDTDSILYHGANWPVRPEDEALIVRAVNAYDLHREAVEALRDILENDCHGWDSDCLHCDAKIDARAILRKLDEVDHDER